MHGDNLFQSPEGREHLSPRSLPKRKNHRTDPFYSPGGNNDSVEASPYTSVLDSPDDMMGNYNRNIHFDKVDWESQKNDIRNIGKKRNAAPKEELEGAQTINLTPPMINHQVPKPTHYSPPRVLTARQPSPVATPGQKSGLGIQMFDEEKGQKTEVNLAHPCM